MPDRVRAGTRYARHRHYAIIWMVYIYLWWRENLRIAKMVCVYDEPDGRGNLRVAKTPPLLSALAGMLLLVALGVVDKINVFCGGLPMQGRGAPRRYKNGGDHALNREGGLIHRDAGNS